VKPAKRESSDVVVRPPPSVDGSGPSSSAAATQAGSGLVGCDYTDARASAQQVFQFLSYLKNRVDDQEGK
jgi:hypothetical protein